MNRRVQLTHIRRLEKLISVFETAKPVKKSGRVIGHTFRVSDKTVLFDICRWHAEISKHYDFAAELSKATSCGTAACVAGTAGLIPEFRKAGFRADVRDNVYLKDREGYIVGYGFGAFGEFFGFDEEESKNICAPEKYSDRGPVTPSMVLRKLRSARKSKIAELNSL